MRYQTIAKILNSNLLLGFFIVLCAFGNLHAQDRASYLQNMKRAFAHKNSANNGWLGQITDLKYLLNARDGCKNITNDNLLMYDTVYHFKKEEKIFTIIRTASDCGLPSFYFFCYINNKYYYNLILDNLDEGGQTRVFWEINQPQFIDFEQTQGLKIWCEVIEITDYHSVDFDEEGEYMMSYAMRSMASLFSFEGGFSPIFQNVIFQNFTKKKLIQESENVSDNEFEIQYTTTDSLQMKQIRHTDLTEVGLKFISENELLVENEENKIMTPDLCNLKNLPQDFQIKCER